MSSLYAYDAHAHLAASTHDAQYAHDALEPSDADSDPSSISIPTEPYYSHSINNVEDHEKDDEDETQHINPDEVLESLATDNAPSCCPSPLAFCLFWLKRSAYYVYHQARSLTKRWLIGVAILLIVNFIWAGSSMAVQSLFSGFDKPFFLTYFSTSLFTLFLSGFVFFKSWRENDSVAAEMQRNAVLPVPEDEPLLHNFQQPTSSTTDTPENGTSTRNKDYKMPIQSSSDSTRAVRISSSSSANHMRDSPSSDQSSSSGEDKVRMKEFAAESDDDSTTSPLVSSPSELHIQSKGSEVISGTLDVDEARTPEATSLETALDSPSASSDEVVTAEKSETEVVPIMTVKQVALLALQFLPIWFFANVTFNWSLRGTSVTSNSIISTTSSFWTLLFCHLFKVERFTILRTMALVMTLGGVTLVAFADKKSGKDSLIGDALAILSAICYGLYASFLRIKIKDEKQVKMAMFFGFVGFFNFVLLWPFFFLLHYTKLELFEIPSIKDTIILTVNGLIGTVASDLLWSLVIFLTSATVATVGLSLNVPFSLILDITIKHRKFPLQYYMGALVVLFGFLVANLSH